MSPRLQCLCPVFLQRADTNRLQQIATAVALRLGGKVFLLTAAHVIDHRSEGTLLIPTKDGIEPIEGRMIALDLPRTGSRKEDKVDVAYVELSESLAGNISESIVPLGREELSLFDFYLEGDLYTFAGYPWRKSEVKGGRVKTELASYTGEAASEARYKALGYSTAYHVVIQFRCKKARHMMSGAKQIAPLPHGISGGGVFSWQKDMAKAPKAPELKCTAVGHTYLQSQHVLVGTRLNVYLGMIQQSHPEVIAEAGIGYSPQPIMMGIVWYARSEWDELMRDFDDANNMSDTWEEWRQGAESGIEEMAIRGKVAMPVPMTAQEIRDFCFKQKLKNNGYARSTLASAKMAEQFIQIDLNKVILDHPAEFLDDSC